MKNWNLYSEWTRLLIPENEACLLILEMDKKLWDLSGKKQIIQKKSEGDYWEENKSISRLHLTKFNMFNKHVTYCDY